MKAPSAIMLWPAVLLLSAGAASGLTDPEDGRYYYSVSRPYPVSAAERRYGTRRKKPFRREEHTAGTLSLQELARTYSMKITHDPALDAYVLTGGQDRLVFVPNMGRFEVNGISVVMPIRPFYQGDRLYVPVEVANFIRTPLPEYDEIPVVIRKMMKLSRVGLNKVFLDPGHGGRDPGALGRCATREKDVNFDIALRMQKLLREQGVAVELSRSDDSFVELRARVKKAAGSNADVFISIHANSCGDPSVSGVETFFLRRHPDSARLAEAVQQMLARNLGVPDRGTKERSLNVLRGNPIPAVLVEVGFLSNPDNEALLRQPFYRQRIAGILVEALAVYSREHPRR
ncbi:MAG: N-acetylmuramoyl-L-alanine amidase [Planctomycetes bacterium]|nr:N-acetylmuramoyl-L-alanine amidase [Planctomycetota bacterium]